MLLSKSLPFRAANGISAFIFLLALLVSCLLAPYFPLGSGWENGPIENLQAFCLFCGGLLALYWGQTKSTSPQLRTFWWMIAPIWFILCARELSWGAVFMQPIDFSPEFGPVFSSSQQLPYKKLIPPLLGAILLVIIWRFIQTKQQQTLVKVWRNRAFPWLELGLFAIAFAISTDAEGHGVGLFKHMDHVTQQVIEELAELLAYIALLMAQWRVASSLWINDGFKSKQFTQDLPSPTASSSYSTTMATQRYAKSKE